MVCTFDIRRDNLGKYIRTSSAYRKSFWRSFPFWIQISCARRYRLSQRNSVFIEHNDHFSGDLRSSKENRNESQHNSIDNSDSRCFSDLLFCHGFSRGRNRNIQTIFR